MIEIATASSTATDTAATATATVDIDPSIVITGLIFATSECMTSAALQGKRTVPQRAHNAFPALCLRSPAAAATTCSATGSGTDTGTGTGAGNIKLLPSKSL